MKTLFYIFTLTAAASALSGCTDSCLENKNALPLAGFYQSGSQKKVSVSGLEVCGVGAVGDSLLQKATESASDIWLPFRLDSDTTRFVFRLIESDNTSATAATDTVTFIYSRTPRFVNAECGVSYIFGISSIETTGLLIDSVTCPSGFIDNVNAENLKIYFKSSGA